MLAPLAWVTGSTGLIGNQLAKLAASLAPQWTLVPLTRTMLDPTEARALRARFDAERPSLLLHCAAITNTRLCDQDPARAHQINVELTARLAELFADARMVFFSTDLVFDGTKGWYGESDPPNPLGVYGATKAKAEELVLAHRHHLVLRTSLNGGTSPTGDRGFNEQLRNAWRLGQTTTLFTDEFRCPIAAPVTARAAWELALQPLSGLWHVAGAQRLSRWETGELVAQRCPHLKPRIQPASLKIYDGAPRAPDCSLSCAKVQSVLSFRLPGLAEWLEANPGEPF
jgi:dTDP-4-dehydrorhamnose reductase